MNKNIFIGKDTNINGQCNLVASKDSRIIIGNYCAIANGLKLITLNHDYNYPAVQGIFYNKYFNSEHPGEMKTPPNKERTKGDVIIGNDVWIGEDVFISSGITIGDGCCIGAKSVVTRDLPPYTICVGTPCKEVKKRYNQEVTDFLLDLKWWNWDDIKIKNNKEFFMLNFNLIKDINEIKKIIV